MHILVVPSWYKSPQTPVYGSFFEEQARALQLLGHEVRVLYPVLLPFNFIKKNNSVTQINDDGLLTFNVYWSPYQPRLRQLSYYLFSKFVGKWFEGYIKQFGKPDVIHAHCVFYAGIAAQYLAQKHNIPLVLSEHNTDFITEKNGNAIINKTELRTAKKVLENAQKSLVVSSQFAADLTKKLQLAPQVLGVMPNMVKDDFLNIPILDLPPKTESFTFLSISFIYWRKNIQLLIDAFAKIHSQIPSAKLAIGGEGEDLASLKEYVAQLGLSHKIAFLGYLDRAQVAAQMQQCQVYAFTSFYESFGVVLIEALAAGKPLISTNSAGPQDIVTPQNGILVPDFEVETFANAMLEMYQNYHKYDPIALRNDAKNRFSANTIMLKTLDIYTEVIKIK